MMIIETYCGQSPTPLIAGKHTNKVWTGIKNPRKAGVATVSIDGKESFNVALARTVLAAFSATEFFDVGLDLGSTVSLK